MNSRFIVVIELSERSCSPQVLDDILGQVREFFDRLSSSLRESTGQHLRATLGPWEAQHRRRPRECFVEVPQSSQNDTSTTPTTSSSEYFARRTALGVSSAQDRGIHTVVQQQGLDSQTFPGESGGLAQRFAQSVGPEDLTTVFPDLDSGMFFDTSSSPFAGQVHPYRDLMERFDVSGQPLPPTHQLLPSNAVSPSDTRENDVGPHIGDETLIHLAANNLAARPVSEYANSQGHLYPTLRWESPQSPANYLTPGLDRPSKSRSSTRELG